MNIYLKLFLIFLQIGAFTFGGGLAMLPMMQQQVTEQGWMTDAEILNFVAVAESTPGPIAINMATFIGMEVGGLFGAFCATFAVVLPSFVVIFAISKVYTKYINNFYVEGCFKGIRPVVIGLMSSAAVTLGMGVFFPAGISGFVFNFSFVTSVVVFLIILVLAFRKVSPIKLLLLSALLGMAFGYADKFLF